LLHCFSVWEKKSLENISKGKMGMMRQWQHWPVWSQDVTPSENRPQHRPSAMSIR
jgi:hypothetical protein